MNDTFQLTNELLNADIPALNAVVARALSRASKGFTQTIEPEHYYQDKKQGILRIVREKGLDLARLSATQRAQELAKAIADHVSLGSKDVHDAIVWRIVWFDSEDLLSSSFDVGAGPEKIDSAGNLLDHRARSKQVSARRNESIPPITAEAVVNALRYGNFDSRELQAIRSAMQERHGAQEPTPDLASAGISGVAGGKASDSISIIDRERDERIAEVTQTEVFGEKAPSLPGFRQYLRRLAKVTDLTYDQKREVCKTVNFWKARLRVQLVFEGQPCSIKARPSGGKGGAYHLRSLDAQRTALKDSASFPTLDIRRS